TGVRIISLRDGSELARQPVPVGSGDRAVAVSEISQRKVAYVTLAGKILFCEVKFESSFASGARSTQSEIAFSDPIDAGVGQPVNIVAYCETKDGPVAVVSFGDRTLVVQRLIEHKTPEGSTFEQQRSELTIPIDGKITALVVDNRAEDVFAGTSEGEIA